MIFNALHIVFCSFNPNTVKVLYYCIPYDFPIIEGREAGVDE